MAPASVQVVCMEPVVFLRGQSAVGEDARGRRRPINFDAPPSQLRGLLTMVLPRPSRIKEITITLQGKARTDWPEGIGPNRLDTVEESIIFKQKVTLYNARETAPARTRPRASSIGPGIDWINDDLEWPAASSSNATPSAQQSTAPQQPHTTPNSNVASPQASSPLSTTLPNVDDRRSPKLSRSISKTAAKAGAAMLPPTIMRDLQNRQHPTGGANGSSTTQSSPSDAALTEANGTNSPTRQDLSASSSPHHTPRPTSMARNASGGVAGAHNSYFDPPPLYVSAGNRPGSSGNSSGSYRAPTARTEMPGSLSPGQLTPTAASPPNTVTFASPPTSSNPAGPTPIANKGKGRATSSGSGHPASSSSASGHNTPPTSATVKRGIKGLLGSLRKDDEHTDPHKSARFAEGSGQSSTSNGRSMSWLNESANDDPPYYDWREFPKGSHSYPFSIPLPSNLPPTLHSDFGSNSYTLRAYVHRAGPLTSNLTAETEVVLVHAPDEDGQDEVETIVVERNWEDALRYMIVVMGKSFPVGSHIPIWAKFVPTEKVRIHRIIGSLEERTAYYAKGRRIARHEVPRRWTLLKVVPPAGKGPNAIRTGILPITSTDPNAVLNSPLAPLARAAAVSYTDVMEGGMEEAVDSALASLADPSGPWELTMDLELPTCSQTRINISSNHVKSNIAVHHIVKLSIRVERLNDYGGVSSTSIPDNQRKLYDILIEAPVSIRHSQTANAWLTLPDYWSVPAAGNTNEQDVMPSTSLRWLRLTAAAAAAQAQSSNGQTHGGSQGNGESSSSAAVHTPQSRQATVTYSGTFDEPEPLETQQNAGLPTYDMIDGALGSVDPPPSRRTIPKTNRAS